MYKPDSNKRAATSLSSSSDPEIALSCYTGEPLIKKARLDVNDIILHAINEGPKRTSKSGNKNKNNSQSGPNSRNNSNYNDSDNDDDNNNDDNARIHNPNSLFVSGAQPPTLNGEYSMLFNQESGPVLFRHQNGHFLCRAVPDLLPDNLTTEGGRWLVVEKVGSPSVEKVRMRSFERTAASPTMCTAWQVLVVGANNTAAAWKDIDMSVTSRSHEQQKKQQQQQQQHQQRQQQQHQQQQQQQQQQPLKPPAPKQHHQQQQHQQPPPKQHQQQPHQQQPQSQSQPPPPPPQQPPLQLPLHPQLQRGISQPPTSSTSTSHQSASSHATTTVNMRAVDATTGRSRTSTPLPQHLYTSGLADPLSSDEGNGNNASSDTMKETVEWMRNVQQPVCSLEDAKGKVLLEPVLAAYVQKGAKWDSEYHAFIFQKKNHFQVSITASLQKFANQWKSIRVPTAASEGSDGHYKSVKISGEPQLFASMYAFKCDQPGSRVELQQSSADRSKIPFTSKQLQWNNVQGEWTNTICKLHFQHPTSNNARKWNRINPHQGYFSLVVTLEVAVGDKRYPLASINSDKIVVRSSHPRQFGQTIPEAGALSERPREWQPGISPMSTIFNGAVGINTMQPTEALDVRGNVVVAGALLQLSDQRSKHNLRPVTSGPLPLLNLSKVQLYSYDYNHEPMRRGNQQGFNNNSSNNNNNNNTTTNNNNNTNNTSNNATTINETVEGRHRGVIAQQLQSIIPEAVTTLPNSTLHGSNPESLLAVNNDRLLYECIGAIQHLHQTNGQLVARLEAMEQVLESTRYAAGSNRSRDNGTKRKRGRENSFDA